MLAFWETIQTRPFNVVVPMPGSARPMPRSDGSYGFTWPALMQQPCMPVPETKTLNKKSKKKAKTAAAAVGGDVHVLGREVNAVTGVMPLHVKPIWTDVEPGASRPDAPELLPYDACFQGL